MDTLTHTHGSYARHIVKLVAWAVALNGLLIIVGTFVEQFAFRSGRLHIRFTDDTLFGAPLIIGLTLLYLSSGLRRRKQTAWAASVGVYAIILLFGILQFARIHYGHHIDRLFTEGLLPLFILVCLLLTRGAFFVRSDIKSFRRSLGFVAVLFGVTFIYGVAGFMLMDMHDFHHEIGFWEATHRTVDQLGLTTTHALQPYTHRARIFADSLSVISIGALAYAGIALYQPLKARFRDQSHNRAQVRALLEQYPADSEDFFKIWPHDKVYYLNSEQTAVLALRVVGGIALAVGDLSGRERDFDALLDQFIGLCEGSDWLPAFIHTEPKYNDLYKRHGLSLQKIGEEAIVDVKHFMTTVARNKYFRNIENKFAKQGYTTELMQPPHNPALLDRLSVISADWLARPGREERGFMMGYYTPEYLQQCPVMIAHDAAGTIQAFMNQVPSFDEHEANFDLLRQSTTSPTNINDYLLMHFIDYIHTEGFVRINLGLCPLAGFDKKAADASVIDNILRFVYSNGDRLYSFSGLRRFKAKYEPEWEDRFVVYRGGLRGFTRTMNALNRAMKVKQ